MPQSVLPCQLKFGRRGAVFVYCSGSNNSPELGDLEEVIRYDVHSACRRGTIDQSHRFLVPGGAREGTYGGYF